MYFSKKDINKEFILAQSKQLFSNKPITDKNDLYNLLKNNGICYKNKRFILSIDNIIEITPKIN